MPTIKTHTRHHPALASAQRAIRRAMAHLTPAQMFTVAALVETLQYGEDRGRWALSAAYAAHHPEKPYRWTCDEPSRSGRKAVAR